MSDSPKEYRLMRITNSDGSVWWIDGHSQQEAEDSFGENITLEFLVLQDVTNEDQIRRT